MVLLTQEDQPGTHSTVAEQIESLRLNYNRDALLTRFWLSKFRASMSLSIVCVLCDKMKESTADILILRLRTIPLVGGDVLCHMKFALNLTHPFKNADFDTFPLLKP